MKFSVIIPLYNKAPYIKKAIESVLKQSFKDFELIIVDDGSFDDSLQVAKAICKDTHCNYQIIHQNNAGVSIARNNGVAVSNGDYICFLDADDWWTPVFLERMDSFIKEYPQAGIYGSNYYYVKNNRQRVCVTSNVKGYINYFATYADKLQMPLWTGAVCIPRDVFFEFGGFRPQLTLGEDFDLWIRIALKHKVAFNNEPLSYYSQDADPSFRLIGKLYDPKVHILWNLDYMEKEEVKNADYKRLIDKLRTYSLLPYYSSRQYRTAASQELSKVDWKKQPIKVRIQYKMPIVLLIVIGTFMKFGSAIKKRILTNL